MKITQKRLSLGLVCILFLSLLTAGIFFIKHDNKQEVIAESVDQVITGKETITKETAVVSRKKKIFKTNDEIKKEYGKLEKVHLWSGKSYTGAVVNTDQLYTIVTIDGTIKIPMKEVKIREIIR